MGTLPLTEAILLEIHQSLGCPASGYATTKKNKFATGQDSLEAHSAMGEEVLHTIFDALDMDPRARVDALDNLTEFGNAYKYLELNTWTFAADERQILWMLLGYFYMPGLARRAAFWSLGESLDMGMPGGRFWYLPEPREVDGKHSLYLPVAQVVDWLLDLLGMPLEEFADKRSQSLEDADDKSSETLMRSLYNWRKETTPNPTSFKEYFPDKLQVKFKGTFSLDSSRSFAEQFTDALDFVTRKQLGADKLRLEIPMTQPGRLEAILDGSADEGERAYFVGCLADRYAIPSPHTIRQRLLFARMVQDGYTRLLKFLCPGVDRQCADARQNKLLQLFAIYKFAYNMTIGSWRNCRDQGEAAENAWFEELLPPWDRHGLYLSILPSQQKTANSELAELLTRQFAEILPGATLEDHVGLDAESSGPIIQRNIERMKATAEEFKAELELAERLKTASPWRTLQGESRYWVVSQIAQRRDLGSKVSQAAIQRLRELAATPSETLQATLFELDGYLNNERNNRPKDARDLVQALLEQAESSPAYELWEAAILQYKAKHLLACNDLEGASKLFKEALEAGRKRCYGSLGGEVARDCLATEVANQKLIVNNHEKYYREMLAGGMMTECEEIPSIEETARWASEYFWDTLYKPYPGVPLKKRRAEDGGKKIFDELLPLLFTGEQDGYLDWIKANRQLLKSNLPDVDGNSVLMLLIKMRTSFAQGLHKFPAAMLDGEQQNFAAILEHWRQFFGLLAQQAPKQLNIADFKKQTPLMLMTETGDTELVRIMLQAGADPEMQDWQGMTALHSAIKSRVDSCVDALLDHPCRLDKLTNDGQSPLHTAAWSGNLHATKRLLKLAPQLAWQRNSQGMTPLERVEYLIENPGALQALARELAKNGRVCPSRRNLEAIITELERALQVTNV